MARAKQLRSVKTRERLLGCAREIVSDSGFADLRVEQVVTAGGVAKGTFFAHFSDKDALMDILIGEQVDALLDDLDAVGGFRSIAHVVESIMPLLSFLSSERYVFDVFLRLSGALAVEKVGAIAKAICRYDRILVQKLKGGPFRQDISAELQSEGIQAFSVSSVALSLCTEHGDKTLRDRLSIQLQAWLSPEQMPDRDM